MHCSNTCRLLTMMGLVVIYLIVELVVGYVVNSLSLVADSFHMLSDFIALCVGVAATRIAKWPRSSKNTFGWQRAEVVGSLVNTVVLVTLCFTILINATKRFIQKEAISDPKIMVFVGIGGLVINVLGLLVIGGHSHSHGHDEQTIEIFDEQESINADGSSDLSAQVITNTADNKGGNSLLSLENGKFSYVETNDVQEAVVSGRKFLCFKRRRQQADVDGDGEHENCHLSSCPTKSKKKTKAPAKRKAAAQTGRTKRSMNMRAVFLHVLADFFGSIIVCVSALLIWQVPDDPVAENNSWKLYVDPAMSVVMVIIILFSTVPLLMKAALILLQSVPNEICIKNLHSRLERIDGVRRVHDLHVWKLQSNCIIGTVHIRCRSLPDYVNIARAVKQLFHENDIHCTTIQPEFEDNSNPEPGTCLFDCGPNKTCQSDTCCPLPPNLMGTTEIDISQFVVDSTNYQPTSSPTTVLPSDRNSLAFALPPQTHTPMPKSSGGNAIFENA